MTDEVEGLVGPVVPTVGVVGDTGGLVVFESEAVDGPVERRAARDGVLVGFVWNVDEFASVVDFNTDRLVSLPFLAQRILLSIR